MEREFLPGDIRDRIRELLRDRNMTQAKLAEAIDCDASKLSRFMSGKTEMLGHEYVLAIAMFFYVSTDFLLGVVNRPGRFGEWYDEE